MSDRVASFIGIESIAYGVEDMERCCAYFDAWGLRTVSRSDEKAVFETRQGPRVLVQDVSSEDFPFPAPQPGSSLREVVWGVDTADDIDRIATRLAPSHPVTRDADGSLHSVDPYGYGIGFRVWPYGRAPSSRDAAAGPTRMNVLGSRERINDPAVSYARAEPSRIGHVVFEVSGTEALRAGEEVYVDCVDFAVSDRYTNKGLFCRCTEEADHHNLALLSTRHARTRFEHAAFEVRDIHEVFGGGLFFSEQGWRTVIGPGRHKVSSAYFWYFENPSGGQTEYFSDTDSLDRDWRPRDMPGSPDSIAEWALFGEVGRFKGFPPSGSAI